jgi:hypothetical protein
MRARSALRLRTHNANPAKGLQFKISPQANLVGVSSNANSSGRCPTLSGLSLPSDLAARVGEWVD